MLMRRLGLLDPTTPSAPPSVQWSVASDDNDDDDNDYGDIPPTMMSSPRASDHTIHLPSFLMGMAFVAFGMAVFILGT